MNPTPPTSHWHPFSPSAAQNAEAIFDRLIPRLVPGCHVFEIGSGTGQHAVHACTQHADIAWYPSERPEALAALKNNLDRNPTPGVQTPVSCDVLSAPPTWPEVDAAYTANTLHIMSPAAVTALFKILPTLLKTGCFFYSYGPFFFSDRPRVASNDAFDASLRSADPNQGVRSVDWLAKLAAKSGFRLQEALELPSNNHILVWQRQR